MKILQLCNRVPWPPSDGGAIAVYNMMNSLHQLGNEVTVLSLNTRKHFVQKEALPPIFSELKGFEMVDIDTDITVFKVLINLFSSEAFHVSRFWSDAFANKLKEILQREQFDIIQLENLPTTLYLETIRKYTKAPVVYRAHNIEYIIWQRMKENLKFGFKKWYLNKQISRLKKYESNAWKTVDGIIAISAIDAIFLSKNTYRKPIHICPVGLNVKDYVPSKVVNNSSVFHLGALNWHPNVEGLLWFVNQVWPLVISKNSNIRFHIAGRDIPEEIKNLKTERLLIDGEVADSKVYIRDSGIMVVPLLSGSGMRVKIIEGLASGIPIVSTSIGAEGINYTDKVDILVADSAEDFSSAILKIVDDIELASTLSINARNLAEREYNNEVIVGKLLSFYNTL